MLRKISLAILIFGLPVFAEAEIRQLGKGEQQTRLGIGTGPSYDLDISGDESPSASAVTRNINVINTISSIGNAGVHFNVYSQAISNDVTNNSANAAHFGAGVFRSSDTHPGRTDMIALEARADARSTTTALSHTGFLAYMDAMLPNAVARSSYTALLVRPCITTDGDCVTELSQGVIKGIWIEAVKGGETDDSRHQLYVAPSPGFNYFGSQVSIGSLSPTEAYGLFVATQAWFTSLEAHAGPVYIQSQAAPAGVAGFAVFYSTGISGTTEMMVKDGAGANTQLSSHADGKWIHNSYYDEGEHAGKSLFIPMEELIEDLEKLTGKRYIFANREEYLRASVGRRKNE